MRNVPELRFDGFEGEWEEHNLNEFISIYGGLTYSPKDVTNKLSDTFVIRSSNVKNNSIIDADNVYVNSSIVNTENVKIGDIILVVRNGSRSLIGKHAAITKDMPNTVIGAFMSGVRARTPDFINALFDTSKFDKNIQKNLGATINQITNKNISEMKFFFTNTTEQEKIGNLFRKIDDLIEIQESKVSKMESFKKSMLQKMFPKKDELVPEFRFDGFDNYGFVKGKINDFIVTHGSKNYIKQPADVGTYKVIQQGDIPIAGYSNEDPYKDFSNVILFGDHTLSLFKPYEPFLLSTDGIKIIFIENIDREYFYYLVQHVMPKSQGYKRHYKILRSVKVNIPKSYKEQQKIGQFFKNLDSQIENEKRLLDSYKMMKKSLLQKMFV